MAETLRLFIAIELPEPVLQYIDQVLLRLRQQEPRDIRWVRPEGIHLTLKFLGDVPEGQMQAVVDGMAKAAEGTLPFSLRVRGAGAFPNLRAPRVLWVGIQGDVEPLIQVWRRLEQALEAQGFARDQRPFSPHLTVGRVKERLSPAQLQRLTHATESAQEVGPAELPVTALSLVQSQLTREGAIYRRKAQTPLSNGLAGSRR